MSLIYREPVLSNEAASMRRISFYDGVTYTFGPDLTPIATVRSGETVEFVCQDACGGQIRTEKDTLDQLDMDQVNGATGPVGVIGSRAGDVIRIQIREIRVAEWGFQSIVSGHGVLGDEVDRPRTKVIPIQDGFAVFSKRIRLPVRPHVGTIGVAPPAKEWTTFYPGDHGGNLDTKEISKGNSVYLPVFQPGAQLAMGDIHALMADGEVCLTGIERRNDARRAPPSGSAPETLLSPRPFVAFPLQEAGLAERTAGGDVPWRTSIRSRPSGSSWRPQSLGSSRSPLSSP